MPIKKSLYSICVLYPVWRFRLSATIVKLYLAIWLDKKHAKTSLQILFNRRIVCQVQKVHKVLFRNYVAAEEKQYNQNSLERPIFWIYPHYLILLQ